MSRAPARALAVVTTCLLVAGLSAPLRGQVTRLGIEVAGIPDGASVKGHPGEVLELEVVSFVDSELDCLDSVHLNLAAVGSSVLGFVMDGFDQTAAQELIGHPLIFFHLTPRNGLCITSGRCLPGLVSYAVFLPNGAGVREPLDTGRTAILKLRLDILVPHDPEGELVVLRFEEFLHLVDLSPRPQRNHFSCEGRSLVPDWDAYSFRVLPHQGSLPGDLNGDGFLDISDPLGLLSWLFIGPPTEAPCDGELSDSSSGNFRMANVNGDGAADITDAIQLLIQLFLGGEPHVLGRECTEIDGCRRLCTP